jgi:ribosome modulation factor
MKGPGARVPEKKPKRRRTREPGDPYAEGHDSALKGAPLDGNPYKRGTDAFMLWYDGWKSTKTDRAVYVD